MFHIFQVILSTRNARKRKRNLPLIAKWHEPSVPPVHNTGTRITWIGHATFLIQIDSVNIITDPIFFDLPLGLKRILPIGIPLKHLPKIDIVLISHNHRDHMDEKSLNIIKPYNPFILVPHGNKKWFDKRFFYNVREYKCGNCEKLSFKDNTITLSFLPASHWSGRTPFDINKSTCGSWMIEYQNKKIYFAGDSTTSPYFAEIEKLFPNIDIAIMPLGPNEPRNLMKHSHISSKESVEAFIELNAKQFIPMHWGTYQTGCDEFETPINLLKEAWSEYKDQLIHKKLHIVKCGEQIDFFKEISFIPAIEDKPLTQQSLFPKKQLQK